MAQLSVIVMCRSERPPPDPTRSLASSATKSPTTQKVAYVSGHISGQLVPPHLLVLPPYLRVLWQHNTQAARHRTPPTTSGHCVAMFSPRVTESALIRRT